MEQGRGGSGEEEEEGGRRGGERGGGGEVHGTPSNPAGEFDQVALRKAKEMASSAVSSVFLTLCGKSDEEDKFTGMQKEMDFHMQNVVQESFTAGMEVAERRAVKEKSTSSKLFKERTDQIVREYESKLTMLRTANADGISNHCSALEAQAMVCSELVDRAAALAISWRQELSKSEATRKRLEEEKKMSDEELASSRAALSSAESKLNETRRKLKEEEERVRELEASQSESLSKVKSKWEADVELMQRQMEAARGSLFQAGSTGGTETLPGGAGRDEDLEVAEGERDSCKGYPC
eukprot:768479-Hanusia_phi.AAC.1